jgi:hypothetical protein
MIGSSNALAQNKDWIYRVWTTNIGLYASITGSVGYVRTGAKRGFLSVRCWIESNSLSTNFQVTSLARLGSILGLSFKNPSTVNREGVWDAHSYSDWQYGNYVEVLTTGIIQLGRYYTSNGDPGDWPLNYLGAHNIMMWNIPVEEN